MRTAIVAEEGVPDAMVEAVAICVASSLVYGFDPGVSIVLNTKDAIAYVLADDDGKIVYRSLRRFGEAQHVAVEHPNIQVVISNGAQDFECRREGMSRIRQSEAVR